MAKDGQSMIRVNSPEYIRLHDTFVGKICSCCGKEVKSLPSCSKCQMASYCSKECQTLDWKEFNHKEMCQHLKVCADLMYNG
uniref:MYND-type domain-containing protein n=1 Tax=Panagrolaimus sp. ES5 TaxID=591445 RepID=A0AC34FMD3_9BILA